MYIVLLNFYLLHFLTKTFIKETVKGNIKMFIVNDRLHIC